MLYITIFHTARNNSLLTTLSKSLKTCLHRVFSCKDGTNRKCIINTTPILIIGFEMLLAVNTLSDRLQ